MPITERGRWASTVLDERGNRIFGSLTDRGQEVIGVAVSNPNMYLQFSGTQSNAIQLPSITMDSFEIDAYIDNDSLQPQTYHFLADARTGVTEGQIGNASPNVGSNISNIYVNGTSISKSWSAIPKDIRQVIKAQYTVSFTDNVTFFNNYEIGDIQSSYYGLKGKVYKITCYLSGNVVALYDMSTGTVQDQSGNGNHASLFGNPTWVSSTPSGVSVSANYSSKQVIYKNTLDNLYSKQAIFKNNIDNYSSKQTVYKNSSNNYVSKQIIFKNGVDNVQMKQSMYKSASQNQSLSQKIYKISSDNLFILNKISTQRSTSVDMKNQFYKNISNNFDMKNIIFKNNAIDYTMLQDIYKSGAFVIDYPLKIVIFQSNKQQSMAMRQSYTKPANLIVQMKEVIYKQDITGLAMKNILFTNRNYSYNVNNKLYTNRTSAFNIENKLFKTQSTNSAMKNVIFKTGIDNFSMLNKYYADKGYTYPINNQLFEIQKEDYAFKNIIFAIRYDNYDMLLVLNNSNFFEILSFKAVISDGAKGFKSNINLTPTLFKSPIYMSEKQFKSFIKTISSFKSKL